MARLVYIAFMSQGIYNYPNQIRGDRISARQYTFTTQPSGGGVQTPMDLTGATIRVDFRGKHTGTVVRMDNQLLTGVTIVDASNGVMRIDEFQLTVADVYKYEIELLLDGWNYPESYIRGEVVVADDVTKDA